MELNILEDGSDIFKIINKYVEIPPPDITWNYNTTWESINFPEGYEKPPRDKFEEELQILIEKKYWKELRAERDRRLAACDWVTLKAYSTDTPIPEEWKAYMQALRDLPSVTEDPTNPVWPVRPDEVVPIEETPTEETPIEETPTE